MKRFLFTGCVAVALAMGSFATAEAGSGKGDGKFTTKIEITNFNEFDTENGDIRIWVLTDTEAADPPTTKAAADMLDSVVIEAGAFADFQEDMGDYVVVGANESHYQGLADDDSFSLGENYQAFAFNLAEGEMKQLGAVNTDHENLVPDIFDLNGDDGGDDDDDDDDDGGDDD